MNRNAILVAALVLPLLAGPLVWLASMEPSPARRTATPPARAADTSQRRPRGVRAMAVEPAPERVAAAEPAAAPAPVPAEAPPQPRAVLHCRLEGLDPEVPPANTVVCVGLAKGGRESVTVDGGTKDVFDVDVSPLLPDDADMLEVAITAERAGYLPWAATTYVQAPAKRREKTSVRDVVLRLQPAGWVKAIVQDERFQRVKGAEVGAWVGWRDVWIPVDKTCTDEEGVFRLRLRPNEANLVVVVAKGMTPASAQVTGVARAESVLTPFTLQPGLALSGSVRLLDGRPIGEATVAAAPIWAKTDLTLGRNQLAYRGGLIFSSPASAPVAEALFRIEGLVPGDYDLSVSARGYAPDLLATVRRRAAPPLERVDIVLDPVRVVVRVTADGHPAPRIAVPVANADGAVSVETDASGAAVFFLKPRTDYLIEFQPKGFEKYGRSFASPAPGAEATIAVELRRRVPWPKLALQLAPADATGEGALESADVLVFAADSEPGSPPDRSLSVAFENGTGTVDGLYAGPYRVAVVPRGPGWRLPVWRRVTVRDGETTRTDLQFRLGGRIRIAVADAAGAPMPAAWSVLAEQRDEQLAAGEAGSGVEPLLPAGRYRVVVTPPSGAPVTSPVTVVAGTTADTRVTLVTPRKAE